SGRYGAKSFIRVSWPTYALDDIIARIASRQQRVKRVCISMVTNKRAIADTRDVCHRIRAAFDIPVSLLISPTLVRRPDLIDFKAAGADKIGVAVDLATPALFDKYRGKGVGGPHTWNRYLDCLTEALEIFGHRNAGAHFVVGMGETEKEMADSIQRVQSMGGWTHLFSFFPEAGSGMEDHPMPDMAHYRRIQLGIDARLLDEVIDSGEPFRTSGCEGYDGQVACNRPYANSRPGPDIRNFPFSPDARDIERVREQLGMESLNHLMSIPWHRFRNN
ncbi:MAG: radical SAM protein, partial [Desulfosarcinaceae bacterium]